MASELKEPTKITSIVAPPIPCILNLYLSKFLQLSYYLPQLFDHLSLLCRVFIHLLDWFHAFLHEVNLDDTFISSLIQLVVTKLFKLMKNMKPTGHEQPLITWVDFLMYPFICVLHVTFPVFPWTSHISRITTIHKCVCHIFLDELVTLFQIIYGEGRKVISAIFGILLLSLAKYKSY